MPPEAAEKSRLAIPPARGASPKEGEPLRSWPLERLDVRWASGPLRGARLSIHTCLAECEAFWRAALPACAASAFQRFEWHSAWQETIGDGQQASPFIVRLAGADRRTLLILPLCIEREAGGLDVLRFLGDGVSDYNLPVIDPDLARALGPADAAALLAVVLRLLPKVDLVWLRRMPGEIDGVPNPLARLPGATAPEHAHAARLPATFEAFRAARSSHFFKQNRYQRRRLAERRPVEMRVEREAEAVAATLDALVRQKSRRWRETGGRDWFAEPRFPAFYRRMTEKGLASGLVHLASLRVGEEIVATHWGLVFRGWFYFLMTGYESGEWAKCSVGRQLLEDLVKCSIEQGLEIYYLNVGDEPYKQHWADHSWPLYHYLAARSVRGSFYLAIHRGRERLRRSRLLRRLLVYLPGRRGAAT